MRKMALIVLLVMSILVSPVFAAGSSESTEDDGLITVAVVIPSPLGDRSFCDSANEGVIRANAELPVRADLIETQGVHEHETAMRGAINRGYDLIMGVGLDTQMMIDLALEYPDQAFASPSELSESNLPANLKSLLINVNKSSFLAGLIAGYMTETGKVGCVAGGDSPGINQFYYGYKQGVLTANPDATVYVNYLGFDFSNPTLGMESAVSLYNEGCDIIYAVCGLSGEGVLQAASETGNFAIGVDTVQDEFYPGSIITSVIKRVDNSTYQIIEDYVNGEFSGGFETLDLEEGATGISWDVGYTTFEDNGPEHMTAKVPGAKALVAEYREKILSGEYEVYDALTMDLWDSLR